MKKDMKFCVFADVHSYDSIKKKIGDDVWDAIKVYKSFIEQYTGWFKGEILYSEEQKFVIVFKDALNAVRFSNSIQVGLFELDWPESLMKTEEGCEDGSYRGFRVRMGIDSSEESIQNSEEVSKICNPGQTLVTKDFFTFVESRISEDSVFEEKGFFYKDDAKEKISLVQILPKVLSQRKFEKLNLDEVSKTNIQEHLEDFFGRGEEVDFLENLLKEKTRLINIFGPGGAGKTSLSKEFAIRNLKQFQADGGAWFIDLSSCRDIDSIFSSLENLFSIPSLNLNSDKEHFDVLHKHFSQLGDTLIIFDNVEQVSEEVAKLVLNVFLPLRNVYLILTSRDLIKLREEKVLNLKPLNSDDAFDLFVNRAKQINSGDLEDRDFETIKKIVQKVDFSPLAIELAASRVNFLSLESILNRLEESFKILTSKRQDLPERQRTLFATINWSWDLLDDEEKRMLAAMSIFTSDSSLDLVEKCFDSCFDFMAIEILQSLREKSLICVETPERSFERVKIYGSVKEFIEEKFEKLFSDSEKANLKKSLVSYYSKFGQRPQVQKIFRGSKFKLKREQFFYDSDNLIKAFEHSCDLGDDSELKSVATILLETFFSLGLLKRLEKVFDQAIERKGLTDASKVVISEFYGIVSIRFKPSEKTTSRLKFALSFYKKNNDYEGQVRVLSSLGDFNLESHSDKDSEKYYLEALDIIKKKDHGQENEGVILANLANLNFNNGEFEQAEKRYTKAMSLFKDLDNFTGIGFCSTYLGFMAFYKNDFEDAQRYYLEALEMYEETKEMSRIASVCISLGELFLKLDNLEDAGFYLNRAIGISKNIDIAWIRGRANYFYADLCLKNNEISKGEEYLETARGIFKESKDDFGLAKMLCHQSEFEYQVGKKDDSKKSFSKARDIAKKLNVNEFTELGQKIKKLSNYFS